MSTDLPASPQGESAPPPSDAPDPVERAPRGRSWRPALVAVVALAAIGVAGYSLKDQLPRRHAAGQPFSPEPVQTEPAALRNLLSVTRSGSAEAGETPVLFVSIGRTEAPGEQAMVNELDPRRLLNELVRQAVLVAAREDLGAVTRDEVLGEEAPPGTEVARAELATILTQAKRGSTLTVTSKGDKAAVPAVLKLPAAATAAKPEAATYPRVLERAEVLAREELPKVLKALGVSGVPVVVKAEGPLPAGVRDRLDTLSFTEQYAAIRLLHAAIRSDGESPERLGGLVRGYANLGTLTEFHWSIAHDVFKARALLAAQRWVARDPRSAEALHHRAYAYALAGLHRFALDDLAAAGALPAGPRPAAAWVPIIESYCRFDTKTLLDSKRGPHRPLAIFLAFRTLEGTGSQGQTIDVGRALLEEVPECYRVQDAVCAAGGVSVQHQATTTPMEVYATEAPRRVQAIPGLSPGIAAQLDDAANEVKAAEALVQEGRVADRGEPSWSALGTMMNEVRFVHVWRRTVFLAFMLGVPAGDFVDGSRPLFEGHRYRGAIEALGVDRARDFPAFEKWMREVKPVDVEVTVLPFFLDYYSMIDPAKGQQMFREAALREDTTEHDLKLFLPRVTGGDRAQNAHFLQDVSPYSPVARGALVASSWPEVEAKARAWEDDGSPTVLVALGHRYIELTRWEDAERCLTRAIKLAPERVSYELLAHIHRSQGDWKKWQETLDEYLGRVEDYGLDHARIREQIANHLMDEGRFKEAEPYAVGSASSWSAFGMGCAERCFEGQKDWANAELWARRMTERYPDSSWARWYLFCKRTGQGDMDAARESTARYIASFGPRGGGELRISGGCFYLVNGQRAEALEMFKGANDPQVLPATVLFTALTADGLGDAELRDQCLERMLTDPQCATKSLPIYRRFRRALKDAPPVPLDLDAVDKDLAALPEENRGNATFNVGWFLSLHESPEKAAPYLKKCVENNKTFFWYQYVASAALEDPARVFGKPAPGDSKAAAPKEKP